MIANEKIVSAIGRIASNLESVNECDHNLECPATVVDGLFAISRAIRALAQAVDAFTTAYIAPPGGMIK